MTLATALVHELERLPAQPSTALQVLWLADDPDAGAADLAALVRTEPTLSARVMRVANSPYYGLSGRVSNATFAITVLGFATVRSLAAATAAGLMGDRRGVPEGFWEHAASVATAASQLSGPAGARRNDAFSLGLLHDIGRAMLYRVDPGAEREAEARARAGEAPLWIQERRLFGMDHAEAASRVLGTWRFPAAFVEAVAHHHDPSLATTTPLGLALAGAEELVRAVDADPDPEVGACGEPLGALAAMGVDEGLIDAIAAQVDRESPGLAASMGAR